jgi:MFS family permease
MTQQTTKAAASGWIGSALEYYDFFIYATAASLIFPQLFFPSGDPRVAIVASLATYGVGYIARPVGAFVLGHWGDTHGRKNGLLLCTFLMRFSTRAVGGLPTIIRSVGSLRAPSWLCVLFGFRRCRRDLRRQFMILEHAPFGRRGFYAKLHTSRCSGWADFAAAVFLPLARYLSEDSFNSWGWRIPFLLSFIVIIAGYVIRREGYQLQLSPEKQGSSGPQSADPAGVQAQLENSASLLCMALMNVIPVVTTVFGAATLPCNPVMEWASIKTFIYGYRSWETSWRCWLSSSSEICPKTGRRPPLIVGRRCSPDCFRLLISTLSASTALLWRSSCL